MSKSTEVVLPIAPVKLGQELKLARTKLVAYTVVAPRGQRVSSVKWPVPGSITDEGHVVLREATVQDMRIFNKPDEILRPQLVTPMGNGTLMRRHYVVQVGEVTALTAADINMFNFRSCK